MIQATYADLDRWRVRSMSVEVPQAGSELAADERTWPWMPPAEVARQSLVAATQHLNLARTAIEARDLYPNSHYTVLRGALVGGAMAVWVLSPDAAQDRQQRALRVAGEWYARVQQYHRDCLSLADPKAKGYEDFAAAGKHLRKRQDEVEALWAASNDLAAKEKLNVTKVVSSASAVVFADVEAAKVGLLWRLMSGDAHALGWTVLARAYDGQPVGGGMGEFRAGGDLIHLADAFDKCYRLVRRGWSLFDRRCEGA